ncbi:EF-P lysine aminoacylase EpmA [Allorhizobium taibaishanense]|uniref:EF-P lysine aminoacylase GenX n=1 Tax=Allorhizobium taibaishanense TaxID=887144 RepID=A0A1Q9ABK3_9HYPH|nr:EF-P lysine aminoacylase EpmA [Allorhizobium taibaishanense]MBB4010665.1 lysyl-tRNA synthetase class 2 [Allorhizobium taibaishanense]OLP52243.1 EF-P lysine aminoacylase GenX [Allorhizobium taibaishanense]
MTGKTEQRLSASPWWTPRVHADRRPFLIGRNAIQAALRLYFSRHDFLEVDTAALQVSPGNEAHLHAFATTAIGNDGQPFPLYLHTSPEFACKKLLAAGEPRLACFAHVYRNRERGPLHHPEFTMLEWYRAGEDYERLMEDCAALLALAAETAGTRQFAFNGGVCDPFAPFERLSVADAFERHAGIDLLGSTSANGETDRDHLAAELRRTGIRVADDDTWADLFSRVIVEKVELHLGFERPTILDRYPVAEAALARPAVDDPRVAERFELYACGVELANGFGELTDPQEQRRRFLMEMAEKQRVYGETYPLDEDFLAALEIMPQASGIALGFDRLVLLATGAQRIDQVLWTPVAEPNS